MFLSRSHVPESFNPALNRYILLRQSVVSGVTTAYNREQLWLANEALITKLQARCRGYLVRNGRQERMNYLKSQDPAVTCIQVGNVQDFSLGVF